MHCRKTQTDRRCLLRNRACGSRRQNRAQFRTRRRRAKEKPRLNEQISQHYIYNSLQVIAGLCDTDPAKAKEAIITFADYLRMNLESVTEQHMILFEREVEHTQVYLSLEKLAGERDFEVEYRLGPTYFMMPPLVLQTVVENAVKHGSRSGKNKIVIETLEKNGHIVIEVTNTSAASSGQDRPQHKHKSVGIENVRTRLASQCNGTLTLETLDGVTKATITLCQ